MEEMNLAKVFSHWDQIRKDLISIVELFNDDELDYVPFPNSWSVREILLHIANTEEGWFQYVVRRDFDQWPEVHLVEDYRNKDVIKAKLSEVHKSTMDYLSILKIDDLENNIDLPGGEQLQLGWIIWHVIEHEIHHRGELSLILGLLGHEGLDV